MTGVLVSRGRNTRDVYTQREKKNQKHMWGHNEKAAICEPRREASGVTQLVNTLILDCEKLNLCCLNYPIYNFLLWKPSNLIQPQKTHMHANT